LKKFSSYEDLKNFVEASPQYYLYYPERSPPGTAMVGRHPPSAEAYSVSDYSATNIQVAGVDEADIVKTDGKYIYVVSGNNVVILKAYPAENAKVLSKIELDGSLKGVFINEDRLVVFEGLSYYKISIKVYDVSDRTSPSLKRNETRDGYYFNSRMIGNYVYVVINQQLYHQEDEVTLPKIYSNNKIKEVSATEIYYVDVPSYSYMLTTVVAVNVQNDYQEPTDKPFLLGATSNMYVSLNNIYIISQKYEKTLIYRMSIEDGKIEAAANGEVPGYVLNQFSMDEHEGYFRIATTTGQVWNREEPSKNHIYVLNMNLNIVGSLENLAPEERIYSARFMGDRCYLVTFRQVDPFFVIDLKDPTSPKVLGQLKIPGFSSYLHPYDEKHVIGIGKEGANVKMSLFDVSDVSYPKEAGKYLANGSWSETPILTDHKAFLFDKTKNLLAIPISINKIEIDKGSVWQGVYVFNLTLDKEFVLKGRITHVEDTSSHFSYLYQVKRSLYIDNVLYTISEKKIKMNSLENLEQINEIELP
jgi:uncharacterized secreted protein with C-terminal beta-propeller domain